jgi:hypothetical protein
MIDVTITEPSGAYISKRSATVPGAAAKQAEKDKISKYAKGVERLTGVNALTRFVPFVLETHGALGSHAISWLQSLCADQPLPAICMAQILNRVSAALQIGNAEMSITGLNSLAHSARTKSPITLQDSDHISEALRAHVVGRQRILWSGRQGVGGYRLRDARVGTKKDKYKEVLSDSESDSDVEIETGGESRRGDSSSSSEGRGSRVDATNMEVDTGTSVDTEDSTAATTTTVTATPQAITVIDPVHVIAPPVPAPTPAVIKATRKKKTVSVNVVEDSVEEEKVDGVRTRLRSRRI